MDTCEWCEINDAVETCPYCGANLCEGCIQDHDCDEFESEQDETEDF